MAESVAGPLIHSAPDSKSKPIVWIVWYVILIPLLIGVVWIVVSKIKERNARLMELERIRQQLANKEAEAQQPDVRS